MDVNVVLPNLGFGMTEGRLISWLKKPGDRVKKGEPIAEVESDKATVELEAVVDGTLTELLYTPDSVVPVGETLARILTGQDVAATPGPQPPDTLMTATPVQTSEPEQRISPLARRMADEHSVNLSNVSGSGPGGRITRTDVQKALTSEKAEPRRALAAPSVRKLARDRGIDLGAIRGTGSNGHVTRADLEAVIRSSRDTVHESPAVVTSQSSDAVGETSRDHAQENGIDEVSRHAVTLTPMRRAIGKALANSMQEAPHFYVTAELDLTSALNKLPHGIGVNALVLYLTVKTLKALPDLNATYENDQLYQYNHVNLSVAVALPNGLISPVLHRADDFSLTGLADRTADLISRARQNRLRAEELGGGTFTVSNLGMIRQIERFTAIINPPQVAILAVGAARPRPFVIEGGLHVRTTAHLTLSVDHRIVDGLIAAHFLEVFDGHLQSFHEG